MQDNSPIETKELSFFARNIWKEVNRYTIDGKFMCTVLCTEENMARLFNSQFAQVTPYPEVYKYTAYQH
jgi:hypothetical protein